jgi:hypothetical protein
MAKRFRKFAPVTKEGENGDRAPESNNCLFHPFNESSGRGLAELFVTLNQFLCSDPGLLLAMIEVIRFGALCLDGAVSSYTD